MRDDLKKVVDLLDQADDLLRKMVRYDVFGKEGEALLERVNNLRNRVCDALIEAHGALGDMSRPVAPVPQTCRHCGSVDLFEQCEVCVDPHKSYCEACAWCWHCSKAYNVDLHAGRCSCLKDT